MTTSTGGGRGSHNAGWSLQRSRSFRKSHHPPKTHSELPVGISVDDLVANLRKADRNEEWSDRDRDVFARGRIDGTEVPSPASRLSQ